AAVAATTYERSTTKGCARFVAIHPKRQTMTNMTIGCKWAAGAAVSIWFAVAGSAQARVFILDDPYIPGEQVMVVFKGCLATEVPLQGLILPLKQKQTTTPSIATVNLPAAVVPSTRIAMASPVRARPSLPLMLGVGY